MIGYLFDDQSHVDLEITRISPDEFKNYGREIKYVMRIWRSLGYHQTNSKIIVEKQDT